MSKTFLMGWHCTLSRSNSLRLLCLLACLWCAAAPGRAAVREGGPRHHMALNTGGVSSVVLSFVLDARLQDVATFTIYVDGTAHTAALSDDNYWRVIGQINVPVPSSPHEFATYAIAVTSYGGSGEGIVEDSRNPPVGTPNYNGRHGMGHETHFITSDISLKGLTWENRACDIYERSKRDEMHPTLPVFPQPDYPNHAFFAKSVVGGGATPRQDGAYRLHPAVYLKGQAPSLKITVRPLSGPVPVRALLRALTLSPSTPGYPFNATSILAANETTIVCPPLKNEVNALSASLRCNFQCQFQDGTWADIYIRQADSADGLRLFSVYAQPTLRSDSSSIPADVPWEELLEQTCNWAAGKSTYLDVAEKITTGLHSSGMFKASNETDLIQKLVPTRYALGTCVDRGSGQTGNCFVVSDYLCIAANMQGLGFQVSAHQSAPGPMFRSNPLALIGQNPTNDGDYSRPDWNIHQVSRSFSETVYDAFAAQQKDLAGADYRKPPINWPLAGYWQTPAAPFPLGLVFAVVNDDGTFVQQGSSPVRPYLDGQYAGFPDGPYIPSAF